MRLRWFIKQLIRPGKTILVCFKRAPIVCTRSLVMKFWNSIVLFCQTKKCFKKDCTGACICGFCEEPDLPSCTRYTTVHHVHPLVEHAGMIRCIHRHALPHSPAWNFTFFCGMLRLIRRHASPACVVAVANVHRRFVRNASSHSSTSLPASGNVHRRIRRHVWMNSAR